MNVYLEYEGKPVLASELTWCIYSPCGCQSGVMVAQSGSYLVPDEETAWKEFFENAAIRKREQDRGYSFKLVPHAEGTKALSAKCHHTPMWGVPDESAPEGFTWARKDKAKLIHLVPVTGDADRPRFLTAEGGYNDKIATRCGLENWSWQADPWLKSEFLTCPKCVATIADAA